MTMQVVCLLIGVGLPYVWAGATVPYCKRQFGMVDNSAPRVQAEQLVGAGARVWGAQTNAWEALVVFAAANGAALAAGVEPSGNWALAAPLWVAARLLHGVFYISGLAKLRVLAFVVGVAMSLWIFGMALTVSSA